MCWYYVGGVNQVTVIVYIIAILLFQITCNWKGGESIARKDKINESKKQDEARIFV